MRPAASGDQWNMEDTADLALWRAQRAELDRAIEDAERRQARKLRGVVGERLLAAELLEHLGPYGWPITYDRLVRPGSKANIDAIVVTPWSVYVLDAKAWTTAPSKLQPMRGRPLQSLLEQHRRVKDIVGDRMPVATAAVFVAEGRPGLGTWDGTSTPGAHKMLRLDMAEMVAALDLRDLRRILDLRGRQAQGFHFVSTSVMDDVHASLITALPSATENAGLPAQLTDWAVCRWCECRMHTYVDHEVPGVCQPCVVDRRNYTRGLEGTVCCAQCASITDEPAMSFADRALGLCEPCRDARFDVPCDDCGAPATEHIENEGSLCWGCVDNRIANMLREQDF